MAVLVDLRNQVQKVLKRINGGNENPHGWSEGVVIRYMNNTGTTLEVGSVVKLTDTGDSNFVELMDTEEGDEVVGIVKGTYEQYGPSLGAFIVSAPSNDQPVAVMTNGVTSVLSEGSISRGQYAYAGSTSGRAKGLSIKRRGAFGRYLTQGSNTAVVRLPLTSIFTGSETIEQYGVERVSDLVTLDFSSGFAVGSNAAADIASIDLAYEQFEIDAQQVKVANSSNYFTAYSPASATETLRPNSDILNSGVTPVGGANGWSTVDEVVLDGADYLQFGASSVIVMGFPATALTNRHRITSVSLCYDADNPAPASDGVALVRNPQTGERYDIKFIPQNVTGALQVGTMTTRPWDARPWTIDDLRHFQAGFRDGTTPNLYINQFYIEVNYTNPVTVEQALNQLGAGGGGGGPHTILSSTHSDSLAGTVVRGDIIRGNSTPAWSRLPIAGSAPSNAAFISDGTDAKWEWPAPVHRITASSSNVLWGQVDLRAGSGVALAVSSNTITFSSSAGGGGGGGSALTVTEEDGSPSVASVDTIKFPNGSVTDLGGGDVMVRDVPQAFIGARVFESTAQSVADDTEVAITADEESYDTDGFHSTSSNTDRLTVPAGLGGWYHITAELFFAFDSTAGYRALKIELDGATQVALVRVPSLTTNSVGTAISAESDYFLTAGQYVRVKAIHTAGNALDTTLRHFSIHKLDSGKVGSGIGAKAYNSAVQSIATASATALTFNTEDFDTDGFHSTVSNTSRFTIPSGLGGKYLITAHTYAPFTGGGFKYLSLNKNGSSTAEYRIDGHDSASIALGLEISEVFDLAAGDYIEAWFEHNQGSNQDVGHASARRVQSEFSIMRLDSGSDSRTTMPGYELSYVEVTSDVTVNQDVEASAVTVVTAAAITFDGVTPVMIEWASTYVRPNSTAGDRVLVWLFEGSTSLGIIGQYKNTSTADFWVPGTGRRRLTPTSGSKTYSIRATVTAAARTGVVGAGAGGTGTNLPLFIRITRAT